jgi:type IV pilus assembly protein PilZ
MADDERRAHPRVPMMVKVIEPSTGREEKSFSREISRGGFFLETETPYQPGQELRLSFQIPGGSHTVSVMGMVVRVAAKAAGSPISGIGVQFVDMDGRSEELIAEYVEKLEKIRKKLSQ